MDGTAVRALARRVEQYADETRARARALSAAAAIDWHSTAAGRFRAELAGRREEIRRAAESLDAAAQALRRHATAVDDASALPAGLVGAVTGLLP